MALDLENSKIKGIPQGLFYYYVDPSEPNQFIGHCPSIQSLLWTPFIEKEDLTLRDCTYNYSKFSDLEIPITVHRIENFDNSFKILADKDKYRVANKPVTDGRASWRNESRLYQYPYEFAMLTDYMNEPLQIRYELIPHSKITVLCKNSISDKCTYYLFIDSYKNDIEGKLEGIISNCNLEVPISNNAYTSYMAYNKHTFNNGIATTKLNYKFNKEYINNQYDMTMRNANYDVIQSMGNSLGSVIGGNITGGLSTIGSSYINNERTKMNASNQKTISEIQNYRTMKLALDTTNAQKQDLQDSPSSISGMGGSVMFSQIHGEKKLDLIRYRIKNEFKEKLGDYFIRYGYKANKSMSLKDICHNRKYFNYVECSYANITGSIPNQDLNTIKTIFERGVTLWHMETGISVGDYSKDNSEVY